MNRRILSNQVSCFIPGRLAFGVVMLAVFSGTGFCQSEVSFNRDIRPILADKCYHCHGPDQAAREADLRLDQGLDSLGNGDRPVIKPHLPQQSELYIRISHADPDIQMPPPESERQLRADEIKLIENWIKQGAKWESHWAFIPPEKPKVPVLNSDWPENEIDAFVYRAMTNQRLLPAPKADKRTLLRRVTLDLTGLPPTPMEIRDFLADDSAVAYEKVVERLLGSPDFGERMAQFWLDAARYADSHGYSLDRRRVMWPWRDWIIEAYNRNLPFDQFATEQLAGDLLEKSGLSQKVATGFNRNHPIQSEGGVINEEYRIETVVDRVETTSAVFLGLTLGCGRCHDHKYEPISQKEFYQFFAFFNNVPETAHVGNRDKQADPPFLQVSSVIQEAQADRIRQEIASLKKMISEQNDKPRIPEETIWIDDDVPLGAKTFGNGSGAQSFVFEPAGKNNPVLSGKKSSPRRSRGLGQHGFSDAKHGLVLGKESKLFAHVFIDPRDPPRQIMLQWNSGNSWEHRAYWGKDLIPWGQKQTASRREMGPLPDSGQWVRLEIRAEDVGLVGRKISGWAFTQFDGSVVWDKSGIVGVQHSRLQRRLGQLEDQLKSLVQSQPTVMVMSEMTPPRKTFVLHRGQYDSPTDQQVFPAVPAALGKWSAELPQNRLGLARWMFSGQNPLAERVAVNRYWQMYFGSGIVSSTEDFGTQGSPPSHPDLLDWLAVEFRQSGWDIKAMQKKIVLSATYQQASKISPFANEIDPENRWLARGPRFRLSAEAIRDQALFVSGLLVSRTGGPSVRPYQPPGLWKDVVYGNVPKFQQDHGQDIYRKSLYTYWKRSVPPPNLQTLDAPSRESCTLKRSRTNTPLGTLVLWNDPTFVEASRVLAEKIVRLRKTDSKSLSLIFELVTSRLPTAAELNHLKRTHVKLVEEFRRDPESADAFLSVGEFPRDSKLNTIQVASIGSIANALLGLDEVVTKH